jgi:hypothetical protein
MLYKDIKKTKLTFTFEVKISLIYVKKILFQ